MIKSNRSGGSRIFFLSIGWSLRNINYTKSKTKENLNISQNNLCKYIKFYHCLLQDSIF